MRNSAMPLYNEYIQVILSPNQLWEKAIKGIEWEESIISD